MTGGFVDWKDQICNIAVSTSCSSLNAIFYCSSCRSLDKEWKIYNDGHVNVISILVIKSCNYAFHDLVNQDLHYLDFCMKNISQLFILFNTVEILMYAYTNQFFFFMPELNFNSNLFKRWPLISFEGWRCQWTFTLEGMMDLFILHASITTIVLRV